MPGGSPMPLSNPLQVVCEHHQVRTACHRHSQAISSLVHLVSRALRASARWLPMPLSNLVYTARHACLYTPDQLYQHLPRLAVILTQGGSKLERACYDRATQVVENEDKFEVGLPIFYNIKHYLIVCFQDVNHLYCQGAANYGLTATRPIYEHAM
jgi:hypothetical protein